MDVDAAPSPSATPPSGTMSCSALGAGQPRRIDSAALLGGRGEVLIVHHHQVYRLRVTAQGKLILTK
jgi:hemin uptake protein HemP